MKEKISPQLPMIDYNDQQFSEASFSALKQYGAFILINVPQISKDSVQLMREVDALSYQSEKCIKPFIGGNGIYDLAGFHPVEQHWGGRRLSGCYGFVSDGSGNMAQEFPSDDLKQAATHFVSIARQVTDKVIRSIGEGFHFGSKWSNYFEDSTVFGIADMYVPATQEKLNHLQSSNRLTMTNDGRLEAMDPHRDVNPITLITYNNNDCRGLEMELPNEFGELVYEKIILPQVPPGQVTPLVLLGEPIQELTGGQLSAPKHRIVLEPMQPGETFNRQLASAFTLFGPKAKQPKSLIASNLVDNNPPSSNKETFNHEKYYASKYQTVKEEQKISVGELSLNFLNRFPREEEIRKIEPLSNEGTMYIRT